MKDPEMIVAYIRNLFEDDRSCEHFRITSSTNTLAAVEEAKD